MSHIFDLQISVLGQQFFQHGKAFFYRSRCGLRILKHVIHSWWNILPLRICYFRNIIVLDSFFNVLVDVTRGEVEDSRLEAKAKDTKKIRGQGQGQPFRGQTLSRPRTGMLEAKAKDQGHSRKCFPKKRASKKFFRQSSIYTRCQNFLLGRPKPQITCNDVIKNLPVGT